jgi:hypothetical protein
VARFLLCPRNSRKTECGAKRFLISAVVRAATFALLGFCSLALAQAPQGAGAGPVRPSGTRSDSAAAAGSVVRASSDVDWRFAHPDAGLKVSLNVQSVLNSPAIAKAIDQGKSQAKNNAMQFELVLAMLKTVDRISLSVRQIAVPQAVLDKAAGGAVSVPPDVLVQVTGSFDPQLIAGFFPSTGTSKVKVMGPHTLLIGEGDSFARATERMNAAGVAMPRDEMEQSDLWLWANSSFLTQGATASSPLGNGAKQTTPLGFPSLRGASMGFNLSDTPEINMLLTAVNEAGAAEILKTIQDAVGQLALANPMAGTAAKALIMKQNGSIVRVHFVVPPELNALGQQLAQQQAASGGLGAELMPLLGMFGLGGPASPAKAPADTIAPAPPPQNGGKIVIYGLDEGPKEISPQK